jgi:hypothetical protein
MRPALFALVVVAIGAAALAGSPPKVTYKDVKPIFDKKCGPCHQPGNAKENLVLTTRAGIIKGGEHGKVVIPKKAAQSKLIKLVSGKAKPVMPPVGPRLSAAEVKKLTDWVNAGAPK